MSHNFGLLELPAEPPVGDDPLTDKGLAMLGDFLATVVRFYLKDAWSTVAPSEPVIRKVLCYDPKDYAFGLSDLPALYLWRLKSVPERDADDLWTSTDTVWAMWVYPPSASHNAPKQEPIFNGYSKCVQMAIHRGKDPSWVNADDTDANKDFQGSSLFRLAGFDRVDISQIEQSSLIVGSESYPAILTTFEVQETATLDPALLGFASGLELHVTTAETLEADALTFNERIRPDA